MSNKNIPVGYIRELDGMRGIAILSVMIFHTGTPFFKGGFIGVDIFFVLSGFLITMLLVREYDRNNHINLKSFYMRRVLRLIPALILLLLVFFVFSVLFLKGVKVKSTLIDSIIALCYASNWARALQVHPPNFLGHTWSLSIEEQFYILWPLILLFLLRSVSSRRNILFIIASLALIVWAVRVLLAFHGASVERLYNGLDTRADALLVGCTIGIAMSSNLVTEKLQNSLSNILKFLAPFSSMILIGIGYVMNWRNMHMYYWLFFVIELLAAVIILDIFVSKSGILKSVLSHKLFVWVGSISYGLYLWHYPIYRSMQSYGFDRLSVITIGSIITFLVASGSYYIIERPFLKLKSRFISTTSNRVKGSL